ncbi:hypothetical protein CBL_09206 [Carabus blaptoides fortunei]
MPKSVRTSRSRRSQHNILNFSSDLELSTRRDSNWWANLSDRSVRRSLIRNVRLRENENATLSDGSYPYEEVNSQWWRELNENKSTILQHNAFKNRNRSNSVVEEDDTAVPESDTEDNVARKMIFPGRQRRSGNYRFSKAFHLEQSQTNEPEVQAETDTYDNGETNNEKNKSAETVARTGESSKRKIKRKTVQLFSRKPYSQRFSEAFHSVEEEKIESEQQDKSNFQSQPNNEEQHSEIIVPATQVSQETPRKSQVGVMQDTLRNIEENIEVNETLTKSKTNLESTTQKKNLFSNIPEKKRTFSEAFLKSAVDDTCVDTNNVPEATENDDTIDTELNQNIEIRKGLFGEKQTQDRKFSEAFSITKHTDDSVNKSNEELAEKVSKSVRKSHMKESEQTKHLDKISEDVLTNEQSENQMEMSENMQPTNLFNTMSKKENRKFSDAFAKSRITEYEIDRDDNLSENEVMQRESARRGIKSSMQTSELQSVAKESDTNDENTRKSVRLSKMNETKQMEISESVQSRQELFKATVKENRKFSEAFAKSTITEHEVETYDNLPENQIIERDTMERSTRRSQQESELLTKSISNKIDDNISVKESLRLSTINKTKQMETSENVQANKDLFKANVKETRKFSEAFAETKIIEKSFDGQEFSDNQGDNILSVNSKMSERKSARKSESIAINQTHTSEILQTKKDLFKNKIKESRKFSEAFAETTFKEKELNNKTTEDIERNKSTAENKIEQPNESSHLSTLPSINDTAGNDKKILFKPKARKSLFSLGNTPNRMKRIDENAAVESEPNPQSSPAESIDQNVVFSDSVMSRFFETSLISSTKLIINPNLTRRNSTDNSQVEENQNKNKNKSRNIRSLPGSHIPSEGISMQSENMARPDQESSRKKIDKSEAQINKDTTENNRSQSSNTVQQNISKHKEIDEESHQKKQIDDNDEEPQSKTRSTNIVASKIMNKGVSKIPVLRTLSKKICKSKTSGTIDNQSEFITNEDNVQSNNTHVTWNKTATEYEDLNEVEISKTKTSLKNISKRATISNEDYSQESQISHSSVKHSFKFITDDIQTHISNNKSSRVSTTAESTDKSAQEKPITRTSSHKNTSKFNLNDIEKNVTNNKSNRISVQQDPDKNTTEIQSSKKQFVSKSLQSESGENEKSKKSVMRTENDISKKVLRFTENYENEIVNENEERTWHNTISSTDRISVSLQRNPILVPTEESKLKSKGDASLKSKNVNKTPVNDKQLQMRKELLLKALKEVNPKTPQITTEQLPSKKITDFFSKINYDAIPRMTKNKVTKSKPKPIPSALLVNGKRYKPEKLFKGAQWCNKRFYKYLQNKLENKYGESTILESENLMKIIVNSAKIILKSKQHPADEITKLKKELARRNVISTTFQFYGLVEDYLPYDIRDKIVPYTRAHYATPTVPYDHEEVYKPIKF